MFGGEAVHGLSSVARAIQRHAEEKPEQVGGDSVGRKDSNTAIEGASKQELNRTQTVADFSCDRTDGVDSACPAFGGCRPSRFAASAGA